MPGNRRDNTVIAKELLPVFEKEPVSWRALRFLHEVARTPSTGLPISWTLGRCVPAGRSRGRRGCAETTPETGLFSEQLASGEPLR